MPRIKLDTTLPDQTLALGHHLGVAFIENGKADVRERALEFPDVLKRLGVHVHELIEPLGEEGDDGDQDQIR